MCLFRISLNFLHGLLKNLIFTSMCLFRISLNFLHGLLKLFKLLKSIFLQLIIHIHCGLQIFIISLKLFLCIYCSLFLFPLLVKFCLKIPYLLSHTSPLFFPCLLLCSQVSFKLCFLCLHVNLQPHFLIFCLLELIFQFSNCVFCSTNSCSSCLLAFSNS